MTIITIFTNVSVPEKYKELREEYKPKIMLFTMPHSNMKYNYFENQMLTATKSSK